MQDERITALQAAETELERVQTLFRNINYQMRAMAGAPRYGAFSQDAAVEQFPHLAPLTAQKAVLSHQIRNHVEQIKQLKAAFTMRELLTISLLSHHDSQNHQKFYETARLRSDAICRALMTTLYPLFQHGDYAALAHYDYDTIIQELIDYSDIVAANRPNYRNMPQIPDALLGYHKIQQAVLLHAEDLKNKARAFMSASHRASAPVARLTPDLLQTIAQHTLLPRPDPNKMPWL